MPQRNGYRTCIRLARRTYSLMRFFDQCSPDLFDCLGLFFSQAVSSNLLRFFGGGAWLHVLSEPVLCSIA